jgi:hypothetical protein
MGRPFSLLGAFALLLLGCGAREAPAAAQSPAPPAPAPAPVAPAARPARDGGAPDARMGMMERHALWKAKKEAEAKLAAQLAAEEQARLMKFDRARLPKHAALLAFTKKTRAQLDAAASKLKGQPGARAQVEKLAASQRKAIEAQGKALQKIDPKGGNSNITNDHDQSLQLLANEYPAAIIAALGGDERPLAEARAELDKREKKIEAWLAELKKAKK